MHRPPKHTCFDYKNGATSIGKGFAEKMEKRSFAGLVEAGLKLEFISFGQIIRTKLESDPAFERLHGATVRKGDLLADEPAIEIFDEAVGEIFNRSEPDIIKVDGFGRSGRQIEHAIANGYLDERDQFYFLDATLETCLKRFLARAGKTDVKRSDGELKTFYYRWHLHRDTVGDLRNTLLEANTPPQIIDIDANPDIAEFVHPTMLKTMLPLAFRQMAARGVLVA